MLKHITKAGNKLILVIAAVMMVTLGLYGILMLWDMYRTEINAFASYDLLQYRPNIENEEPPYLDDLVKINPDTVGWVTIYGTNIDYPVMKGKDDVEYLNKDPMGDYSISGSIFMSYHNAKDFSDPYTLLYGHHMENGSMFGDLDKFRDDKDFFFNKNDKRCKFEEDGVLIMQEQVYNLRVMALLETTAYDHNIYMAEKKQEEIPPLCEYLQMHSKYKMSNCDAEKIIALSTCASAVSFDRTVLICEMKLRTDPLPTREKEPLTEHREAVGHPMAGAYWALLNLLILLCSVWFLIGLIMRKVSWKLIGVESLGAIASVILFVITEDLHKPIQVIDIWTLPMIVIFAAMIMLAKWGAKDKEE